jgi:hypothetical protein
MSAPKFGHRLCVGWVIWYTRRVPWEVAAERRDELFSDLWEHAAESARRGEGNLTHQLAVIRRVLAGIPADLSWRRAVRSSHGQLVPILAAAGASSAPETGRSKRWRCRLVGHHDGRHPYPGAGKDGGHYLLCRRCGRVRDDKGSGVPTELIAGGSQV